MIDGTGAPKLIGNSTITLPTPAKRQTEREKEETKTFTNINNQLILGETKYRFEGVYRFVKVTSTQYNNVLKSIVRNRNIVRFLPYSEITDLVYTCYARVYPINVNSKVLSKGMILKVRQVDTSPHRTSGDLRNKVFAFSYIMKTGG